MKTLIYARYSSHLQNSRSIEDQIAICRDRAEREGWPIVGIQVDREISGAAGLANRPGLEAALAALEAGEAEQLLAESTDRLARHQGDAFALRERVAFAGGRIFTLSDGVVDEITGTFKGLMDSLFRKELRAKIRRGQAGTVREGRVPGGLAFGYRVANRLDGKGGLIRGIREIVAEEAAVVVRIFTRYAAGESPRTIAAGLNAERIPGPRGQPWRATTIGGDRKRRNGILQNRLYAGEIVTNRTSKITDPRTRKALIRPNAEADWVSVPAPELRIIEPDLWERVQAIRTRRAAPSIEVANRQRRPRHLLSGLAVCGVCGGRYSIIYGQAWGCGRNRDGQACPNNRQITTATLEATVLAGLREHILAPEAVALFVKEYTAERSRVARELGRDRGRLERDLAEAERRIERLVAAVAEGLEVEEIHAAIMKARADRDAARAAAAELEAGDQVITLHPRLADNYREMVAGLLEALQDPEFRLEAVPIVRSLIERVVLEPKRGKARGCRVRLEGRLSSLLALATGAPVVLEASSAELSPTVKGERVKRLTFYRG